jgi:hypothetical protein
MPSLNFKGKALVQNLHLLVPYSELKPVKSKSLTDKVSLHDNLVVHGDNLKALKALLPYYHGKAKSEVLQKGLGGSFSFIELGNAMQLESLLKGDKLPSYADLAGYVFYTSTGEEFDARAIKRKTNFIGESAR